MGPDVCVSTSVGIAFAVVALAGLALFIRSRRRKREPWSRADWFNLIGILIAAVVAIAGFVECTEELPDVRISLADSTLNPVGYDDPSDEYVCLINGDDHAVALVGWELHAAERRVSELPDFTLKPDEAVRVHPGGGASSDADLYGERGSPAWRNESGLIVLYDNEGREIDAVGYGERRDGDGTGQCGSGTELALKITGPEDRSVVSSATGRNSVRVQAEKRGLAPVVEFLGIVRQGTSPPPPACDRNYEGACLDPKAVDYDCAGGEGDGPAYIEGPIRIVGEDRFDLDRNGDGVACEP